MKWQVGVVGIELGGLFTTTGKPPSVLVAIFVIEI